MHHDVRAAAHGLIVGQGHCEFRIHDGKFCAGDIISVSALDAGLLIRDDRVVAHLGACCRDRQNNTYGKACRGFSLFHIKIPHITLLGIRDSVADGLGGIDDTAAADSEDKVNAFLLAQFDPFIDQAQMGIGNNAAQRDMADPGLIQRCTDPVDQAGTDSTLAAIVDQDLGAALLFDQCSESPLSAFSENHLCRCIKIKICSTNHYYVLSFPFSCLPVYHVTFPVTP